jgi:carboxyl-terminal processing protease
MDIVKNTLTLFLGLSFAIFLSGASSFKAQASSMEEYWQQVGLSFSDISDTFLDSSCKETLSNFIGCIEGVQTLFRSGEKSVQLIPSTYFFSLSPDERELRGLGLIYENLGSTLLVKMIASPRKIQDAEAWNQYRNNLLQDQKAWADFYENRRLNRQIDFSELYEKAIVHSELRGTPVESVAAANAYNQYLSVTQDPHTMILPKEYYQNVFTSPGSSFAGIGIQLRKDGDQMVIVTPTEGGPALWAGIRANDIIISVDDTSVDSLSLEEVVSLIQGEVGEAVRLGILRDKEELKFEIVREIITSRNLIPKTLDRISESFAYIKINHFMEPNLCLNFFYELLELLFANKRAEGLIIDLRGNGGGSLLEVHCISSIFSPEEKPIYSQQDPQTGALLESPTMRMELNFYLPDTFPVVIMIDAGSASASEILAGALQDHGRALIIGERSYGKGTVQYIDDQYQKGIVKKQTISRFHLPSGRTNQLLGIIPDIETFREDPVLTRAEAETGTRRWVMREEDHSINVIPSVGETWTQPRKERIAKISDCMATRGQNFARYFYEKKYSAVAPDYQIITAMDALHCEKKMIESEGEAFLRHNPRLTSMQVDEALVGDVFLIRNGVFSEVQIIDQALEQPGVRTIYELEIQTKKSKFRQARTVAKTQLDRAEVPTDFEGSFFASLLSFKEVASFRVFENLKTELTVQLKITRISEEDDARFPVEFYRTSK